MQLTDSVTDLQLLYEAKIEIQTLTHKNPQLTHTSN